MAETQAEDKILGKRTNKDDLRFKPNLEMLADQEDDGSEDVDDEKQSGQSQDDFDYGDEDESDISEDKPLKEKKSKKNQKTTEEKGKDVYKPAKLNPIMYQD